MLNFIILGPQGAGKGTQAQLLAKKFNMPWIEAGRLLREKARDGTKLGEKIGKLVDKGVLVPDEIVTQIIKEEIKKVSRKKGIIFDGYPRNLNQAKELEKILKETKRAKYKAIFVNISEKEILRRASRRKLCSKCGKIFAGTDLKICDKCGGKLIIRRDDKLQAVMTRLEVYRKETEPVLDYYKKKNILIEINGEQSIKKVYKDMLKNLEHRM